MGARIVLAGVAALVAAACAGPVTTPTAPGDTPRVGGARVAPGPTATIALVGDVMLGRGVGAVVANDPDTVFERVRSLLAGADLAFGNLESPLTTRPHATGEHALEADPASAGLLADAGFDAMGVANNHAGDAGPAAVTDSVAALAAVGIAAVGGGADAAAAGAVRWIVAAGLRVAVLAYDLTGGGPPAEAAEPGVARWDPAVAEAAVRGARADADVVIVGIHGGIELLRRPDPVLTAVADQLASWGADVVWGHGTHVAYPVEVAASGPAGRPVVLAPGLGNALFDQTLPGTDTGTLLEVLVGPDGVRAWRTASLSTYLRTSAAPWDLPSGDAVTVDGEWWSAARPVVPGPAAPATGTVDGLRTDADIIEARLGDVDGDGSTDAVVSYRRPWEPRLLQAAVDPAGDGRALAAADGRSAHLAWFSGGRIRWGAGTLPRPVAALDVCDDGLALALTTLVELSGQVAATPPGSGASTPEATGGSAWWWRDFGFATAPELPGAAVATCADPDGDGRTSPALVRGTERLAALAHSAALRAPVLLDLPDSLPVEGALP